jgi:hypothetical protein
LPFIYIFLYGNNEQHIIHYATKLLFVYFEEFIKQTGKRREKYAGKLIVSCPFQWKQKPQHAPSNFANANSVVVASSSSKLNYPVPDQHHVWQ